MTDIPNELKALRRIVADVHERIDLLISKLEMSVCVLCGKKSNEGRGLYDKFICEKCDNSLQHGVID